MFIITLFRREKHVGDSFEGLLAMKGIAVRELNVSHKINPMLMTSNINGATTEPTKLIIRCFLRLEEVAVLTPNIILVTTKYTNIIIQGNAQHLLKYLI